MNKKLIAILLIACIVASITLVSARYISGGRRISGWQLLDETITGSKISNETIDSEHYVNASIDNEHVNASCINSSQIVDGTIANADIASSAVNDTQLAANSIRNATNKDTTERSVTGTTYADSCVNTTITLARTSMLIINYAAEGKNEADNATIIKCEVGGVVADPAANITFLPANRSAYQSSSFTFYNSSVPSGTHNINISFKSGDEGTVYLINQSLAVIALPA